MATSSTTIPVDGRTNKTLSLPFTYCNPCSPSMAARLSGSGRISRRCSNVSDACLLEVRRVGSRRGLVGHYRLVDLLTLLRIERQRPSHHRHVVQQIVPVGEFGRHGLPPLGPRPAPPSQL